MSKRTPKRCSPESERRHRPVGPSPRLAGAGHPFHPSCGDHRQRGGRGQEVDQLTHGARLRGLRAHAGDHDDHEPGLTLIEILVVLAIILGVDRILDMCRTTLNVTGDITAATYVARSEGYELLKPRLNAENADLRLSA